MSGKGRGRGKRGKGRGRGQSGTPEAKPGRQNVEQQQGASRRPPEEGRAGEEVGAAAARQQGKEGPGPPPQQQSLRQQEQEQQQQRQQQQQRSKGKQGVPQRHLSQPTKGPTQHKGEHTAPQEQKPPPAQTQTPQEQRPQQQRPGGESDGRDRVAASRPQPASVNQVASKLGATILAEGQSTQRSLAPPKRPDYGTKGRHIQLRANFFPLVIPDSLRVIYHYDVEITPESRSVNRQVIDEVIKKHQDKFGGCRPAFDGRKNLFCKRELPLPSGVAELVVTLPGEDGRRDRKFKVKVQFAAKVNLSELEAFLSNNGCGKMPQEAVQAIDIVLRQIPSCSFISVGRSFFPMEGGVYPLDKVCDVRSGFIQSVRPSQWKKMLVNIDVSSKGFYKEQEMVEFMCEFLWMRPRELEDRSFELQRDQRMKLEREIKGVRFQTTHVPNMKRKYTVTGLARESADLHRFDVEDERTKTSRRMSVTEYFRDRYKYNLRYPHLPCVKAGKERYLPIEVCRLIPGPKRNLTELQTANMIKHTAVPAPERKRRIEEWARGVEECNREYLQREYNMRMSTEMVKVDGRVLSPPAVELGGDRTEQPRNGSWDMRNKKFKAGEAVGAYAVACFSNPRYCGHDQLRNFFRQMSQQCGREGMRMSTDPVDVKFVRRVDELGQLFPDWKARIPELQLIFVVIQKKSTEIYAEVKHLGDNVLGVATQCVQEKLVQQAKPQVCSNIAMKINAKLGGVNHTVQGLRYPDVIFFGADVTHPGFGESIPSIAAVVASLDPFASKYCARVRAQTHAKSTGGAQEIIIDLAEMVKECLIQFYKHNGKKKPQRIVFYRDGVSEGQFEQVLLHEVRAVQQACMSLEKDYRPLITFLVVQKRHHARLFCENPRDASGKAQNVPPGTTVDTGITHPFEFDFYLCSHQGIQGTSRPAHYHVLYDDNNFTADKLHELTYQLCHTFARCTRSVSIPAPAYYAHLVAFRARYHVKASDNGAGVDIGKACQEIKVHDKMWSTMYFA